MKNTDDPREIQLTGFTPQQDQNKNIRWGSTILKVHEKEKGPPIKKKEERGGSFAFVLNAAESSEAG